MHLNLEEFQQAHDDFNAAIAIEKSNAKFHHAKGLAYQSEADKRAEKVERDLATEDLLISQAIECFGDALSCDPSFISSMFHQGLMFRRTNQFNEALNQFSRVQDKLPDDKTVYI